MEQLQELSGQERVKAFRALRKAEDNLAYAQRKNLPAAEAYADVVSKLQAHLALGAVECEECV